MGRLIFTLCSFHPLALPVRNHPLAAHFPPSSPLSSDWFLPTSWPAQLWREEWSEEVGACLATLQPAGFRLPPILPHPAAAPHDFTD